MVAREFFLEKYREGLPKVPACERCNSEKSVLEHYLTSVLPFGGKHPDALVNLATMVPKRLQKNLRLREELRREFAQGRRNIGLSDVNMNTLPSAIPINHIPLENLFAMMAKGLAWHHWRFTLGTGYSATAAILSDHGKRIVDEYLFALNARNRVAENIGGNAFAYEGLQAKDDPKLTLWRFSIYGGVSFGGGDDPRMAGQVGSQIIAVTGPEMLLARLSTSISRS